MGPGGLTCCTSAAVLRKSSMYRLPSMPLCLRNAACASSSQAKRAKASPVGRPSGWRTKSSPSAPPVTGHSGPRKPSTSAGPAEKGSPRSRRITWSSRDRKRATSSDVPWGGGRGSHLLTSSVPFQIPTHTGTQGSRKARGMRKQDICQEPGGTRHFREHTHPLRSSQTPLLLLYTPVGTAHGSHACPASALSCSAPNPRAPPRYSGRPCDACVSAALGPAVRCPQNG